MVVCSCFSFACAAVTIPQLHEYIENKLTPTDVYTCLMYASDISLSHPSTWCTRFSVFSDEDTREEWDQYLITVIQHSTGKGHSFYEHILTLPVWQKFAKLSNFCPCFKKIKPCSFCTNVCALHYNSCFAHTHIAVTYGN